MSVEMGGMTDAAGDISRSPPASRRRSKEALRVQLYLALAVLDILVISLSYLAYDLFRGIPVLHGSGERILTLLLPIYIVAAVNSRAYTLDALLRPRTGIRRGLLALAIAVTIMLFISFSLKTSSSLSRLSLFAGSGLSALAIIAARYAFDRFAIKLFGISPLNELLIHDGFGPPEGFHEPSAPRHIVNAGAIGLEPDISDPMMMDRLGRLLQHVDRVVVSCPSERRSQWATALKGTSVRSEILVPELTPLGIIGTGQEGGEATLQVSAESLGIDARIVKRAMDLALVTLALVALAPLMLVTAAAIRLEDGGPVFFVQERLGRGNRLFNIYKFRSMKISACDAQGNVSTARDDLRVTRVGRFIRATSIDELPQLFNILRGDMSIVGPRPHALGSTAGDKLFWEVDLRYWHRHASKPGLTGLAQVRGYRGATHSMTDLVNRLQADLEYQRNWTILRDLSIMLATIKVMVHRNAF
ncbi:MAG TPA: sugar transferase [Sphingomonas sp.]|nr:sugar transferase [Sphingomonas sp.]